MNHTDADTFLDQILLNPECHTTRLVYADYLDEQITQEKRCDPKAVHRHVGEAGYVHHGVMHDTDPLKPHHHCDEKCWVPSWHAEAAAFWRAQVYFPYEVKTTLDHFFAVAPFLALFPMLEWVELANRRPREEKHRNHPATYHYYMTPEGFDEAGWLEIPSEFDAPKPFHIPRAIWNQRLSLRVPRPAFPAYNAITLHTENNCASTLSTSCLEYVWSLQPECDMVDHARATWTHTYQGKRWFWCDHCAKTYFGLGTLIPLPRASR